MNAAALVENLKTRAKAVKAMRSFFDERSFVEVETPVRIPAPAPEEHIDCPLVPPPDLPGVSFPRTATYLRASPELQMKKLLAAGMERIYQIGPCFREGEYGARHNAEFTMLEWYRKGATYLDIKSDLVSLLSYLSGVFAPSRRLDCACRTLTVREAYRKFALWDPWEGEWDQDRFDFDMAAKIEKAVKEIGGGVFLTDYPPQASSLALLSDSGYPFAQRWEFYFDGMELANCFTELCDEEEQRRRFLKARNERKKAGESDYPLDEEFLSSLGSVGSASGVALGVDRLVMILAGEKTISSVRAGCNEISM